MKFIIDDLSLRLCDNKERFAAAVEYFADGDITNDFFLAPVTVGSAIYGKEYWEGFAKVLVKRGVLKLGNDRQKILHWLEDFSWPGSGEIIEFVSQNLTDFLPDIIVCLSAAVKTRDVIWFKNILSFFYSKSECIKTVVGYLDDDCWKDFNVKFKLVDLFY
ncbi:MAG: hypothetical protein K2N50_02815 [Clostridia bacterium]|nr:hypothetical protein [Clostridia bacterium]